MNLSYEHLDLSPTKPLIIAVSGGADSVALIHMMEKLKFECVVAHVNHQLRDMSTDDAQFVEKLADDYGMTFELKTVDIQALADGENLEAIGRQERYKFFRELVEKYQAQAIVTAHHADDQVETVLMNMVRGCGLDGLAGMSEYGRGLWRPLLSVGKDELLKYCEDQGLSFREDESNQDERFRRNYLRKQVVPSLKELNPNLLETMGNNISLWREASQMLLSQAILFIQEHQTGLYEFSLAPFLALDEALQALVLREIYADAHGTKKDLEQAHLDQVLKVIRTNVSGKQKEFGNAKMLIRNRESFRIIDQSEGIK
ncbi:MAG: tRNA lysidine(34) synthetase TilS [Candidatus Gracilibacteria bacterium]|nr:tRNA lysidine(34) synthetase TilS [Candidatus Gracilibacteria bacterium]